MGVDDADTVNQCVNPANAGTGGINVLTDIAELPGPVGDRTPLSRYDENG